MAPGEIRERVGYWTVANQLTFLRLVAVPFFILAVLGARFGIAFAIFVAAGVTDLLDGLIARLLRQRSRLGEYLDPAADKILMTAAFILLTAYPNLFQNIPMTHRIPIWLTILAISRDVFIVAVALMLYLAYGRSRFRPTFLGKAATVSELILVGAVLLFNALERDHPLVPIAIWGTLGLILASGLHYLARTVQEIRHEGVHPPDPPKTP